MNNNQDDSKKSRADKELQDRLKELLDKMKRLQEEPDSIHDISHSYIDPKEPRYNPFLCMKGKGKEPSRKDIDFPELNRGVSDCTKSSSSGQATGFSGSPLHYNAVPQGGGGSGGGGAGVGCAVFVVLLGAGFLIWLIFRIVRWLM